MEKPAQTDLPLHDLLRRRWSPRAFADRSVASEALRTLIEAARWAPSAMNEQPWRFLVADRDNRVEFERMLACLVPGNQRWAKHAPVLILTVAQTSFARNQKPNPHAWHDVGLAIATLTVQATALGLSVHQMGGIDRDAIRETYGIPDGFEPVTAVAIGYPGEPDTLEDDLAERERAPRSRKPQAEIAFAGRWGQAV